MNAPCPLCGRDKYMKKPKQLYGHAVCKKCVNGLANRRQIAFVIDIFLIRFAVFGTTFAIGLAIVAMLAAQGREIDNQTMAMLNLIDLAFTVVALLLIAAKDGFHGLSPGKALLGVRVVDQDTNAPIGFLRSMKRNWPVLIPIMPLVIAVQMLKGGRAGDGLARTRVIWTKYAQHPIFTGRAMEANLASPFVLNAPPPAAATDNPYEAPRF